jgi:hypothetical protein
MVLSNIKISMGGETIPRPVGSKRGMHLFSVELYCVEE